MALASGLVTVVVSAAFVLLLLAIDDLRAATDRTRDAREELKAADKLEMLVIDLETGLRGFVITRDERFLEPFDDARAALPAQARRLESLVPDDPVQRRRVRRIVEDIRSYVGEYAVPLVNAVRRDEAGAGSVPRTVEGKRRVDALREQFANRRSVERANITAREDSADAAAGRAIAAGIAGLAGSILLMLVFTGYLTRGVVRPIRSSLGASREQLARLLEEQAALRRVATLVARAVSPAELFETVTRELGSLSGADLARMERYEPDGTVTGVGAWTKDGGGRELAVGTRMALEGVSIAALVRDTNGPVRVDSFADASGPIAQEARELGIRSSVGGPIVVEGRLWGVIAASSRSETPFPPDTESQIGEFTELVATAISNSEARAEVTRLADEQAALRRVATLVAQGRPAQEVFATVAEEVAKLLRVEVTMLIRYESEDQATPVAEWSHGRIDSSLGTTLAFRGRNVTTTVYDTGRPARLDDYASASGRFGDAARDMGIRSSVGSPIVVEGRLWGVVVAASLRPEGLPPGSEFRIGEFTELVATAIANLEARAALAASRARIVAATDEARRRFERDLHDGAQQGLVSLALELRGAEAMAPPGSDDLKAQLAKVREGLTDVLERLRALSQGIHPAILSQGGLGAALRALARGSAVPTRLDVDVEERLDEQVEVAAYYVVSEALANAAKHAQASVAEVRVESRDGVLSLTVRDDGTGGADPAGGSGLTGLSDRVEAFGGKLAIDSPRGGGTSLHAELPLEVRSSS
jgi:signal transduction histidine kinase/CHASE3 domain sensor protein